MMNGIFRGMGLLRAALLGLGVVLGLGAVGLAPAQAADSTPRTVRVGFFAMDGYHMEGKNGARSGYGYDFLQLAARYSNLRFTYVGYDTSWDEMLGLLRDGKIDLLTPVRKTAESEAQFGFTRAPIGSSTSILTVKAGDTRYVGGNYAGMRIGLGRNISRNAELAQLMARRGFAYTPVYFDNLNELTAALQEGTRIDAAMTNSLRWTRNEWTLEELGRSPFYAIARKDDTALLSALDTAIERMDSDSAGWRTRLQNKHYSMGAGEVVAFSNEERTYLAEFKASGRKLRVTMNPDSAPYSYFEQGRPLGIIPRIFTEVAARLGIDYELIEPADREAYHKLCVDGSVDVILDGLNDFYTVEVNGLKITEAYYSTPLAVLTAKPNVQDVRRLKQPAISVLNEAYYSFIFDKKTTVEANAASLADIAESVKTGRADGSYLPYYCAQWLGSADVTGALRSFMLPQYERAFVYAVRADLDVSLLPALNKAVGSISEDEIASIVAASTQYPDQGFSLLAFVHRNLPLVLGLAALFIAVVLAALFFANKSLRAQKELLRSRRMERYIGYLCDMYYKVMEVDLDLRRRVQYMKRDGTIEIQERDDFTAFDIASIHPDDVEACLAVFSPAAIRALFAANGDKRYVESRMRGEDGAYRWYDFQLKLIPRDNEHPCSVMLLIRDVDELHHERERSRTALLEALDAANKASRSKSVFLSSMSHEIRTPLNAVIGYMTIASTALDNRDKVSHCVDSAGVAARHLLSIINDVLDISAMESGKMKLAKDRFDLKEQLSGLATVFYQQCKQKNITFAISINNLTEEWVVGDPMRFNQILMNLMSNAVKFTSSGGVTLTVAQTSQNAQQVYIRFTVQDTGIGMSKEYLGRLFAPFEQESAQTTRKYGGTGLGMSITRNLVTLMGGTINVDSQQGAGSTFTVTMPFGRTEFSGIKAKTQDFSHLRVLIVDDLKNECEYIHALLTRCGVHSETAQSGEEAVQLVARCKDTPERFDLCIIDWNMPGLDGVQTTRLIHQECDPQIPIIIATAYDISEFASEALAAGAARVVSKPLFQSTLLDLLVSTYGKYESGPTDEDSIPDLTGMHVLLAEDNETNMEVAVDILELAGVSADTARNGQEAVDLFLQDSARYDAILMDVQMPVLDGYAATRQIRASGSARARTIPIIALTADAFAENVAAALAAGMNDHVAKPIETEVLFATLKRVFQKAKTAQAR